MTQEATIRVRVTPATKRAMSRAAARQGLTLSAWLRAVGLRELRRGRS